MGEILANASNAATIRRRARMAVSVLVISSFLVGCAQNGGVAGMGQKETAGTAAGAVLGAVAGSFLGKGAGKAVAILAGGAIGAFIGNQIGAMLDEDDQKALAEQARQALVAQPDNVPLSWTSDHSGAQATVVPENTRTETRQIKVVRDAQVAPSTQLDLIGARYVAKANTNVRLAPSTDAAVGTTLAGGAPIWAVGRVREQDWIMVARHGKSIGYVAASTIQPAPKPPVATVAKAASAPTPVKDAAAQSTPFDLDEAAPVRSPADLDAIAQKQDEKADLVVASVTCRDIKTTATAKGDTATSTQVACKSPDGAWQLN